jgi:two-component SAPR family response regulator
METLALIRNDVVDLIYLDINMTDIVGIEFIKGSTNPPKTIFITAYAS